MRRRRRFGGGWRLPADETASAKRITARCGDGRAWRGWAASGKTATRPASSCANAWSCGAYPSTNRMIDGTSNDGCRRKLTAHREPGTRRLSNGQTASACPRLGLIPIEANTSIASRSKDRAANSCSSHLPWPNTLHAPSKPGGTRALANGGRRLRNESAAASGITTIGPGTCSIAAVRHFMGCRS